MLLTLTCITVPTVQFYMDPPWVSTRSSNKSSVLNVYLIKSTSISQIWSSCWVWLGVLPQPSSLLETSLQQFQPKEDRGFRPSLCGYSSSWAGRAQARKLPRPREGTCRQRQWYLFLAFYKCFRGIDWNIVVQMW